MKITLKYLLSLCVLLLSGHNHLSAHSCKASLRHISLIHLKGLEPVVNTGSLETADDLFIVVAAFSAEKPNYRVNVLFFENEEDDDLISFRKHLNIGNHTTSFLFTHAAGTSSGSGKIFPPFSRNLSDAVSYRYLMFQTFRI